METLIKGGTLNKKEFLIKTNNGLDYFNLQYGGKLVLNGTRDKCKNVKSKLYDDKNGSVSFYLCEDGKWRFKDYGNTEHHGDIFDYASIKYGISVKDNFQLLIYFMNQEIESREATGLKRNRPSCVEEKRKVEQFVLQDKSFTKEALDFWISYDITKEILERNNVKQITGYTVKYLKGKPKVTNLDGEKLYFAYPFGSVGAKIYCPNPKRFWYIGKVKGYYFGAELDYGSHKEEPLFIVAGEKDVMSVQECGHEALSLQSEATIPSRSFKKWIYETECSPYIIYDNDEAGRKGAEQLAQATGWEIADWTTILSEDEKECINDISDFVKEIPENKDRLKEFLDSFNNGTNPEYTSFEAVDTGNEETEIAEDTEESAEFSDSAETYHGFDRSIFQKLSPFLQKVIEPLDEPHEQDLVLIGCLSVLGNVFNISGLYDNRRIYPNIMAFITAPASAGKGALKWSKCLGGAIQQHYKIKHRVAMAEYEESGKEGPKPKREHFFISGNSSASAMINTLYNSHGSGVILEYEADALNNAIKQDWGNYSEILRKAYEHETITKSRVDDEIDIDNPRLSVAISGTKDQLFVFMPNTENGLFSRFLFYEFPLKPTFKNVFANKRDLHKYYSELSETVHRFYLDQGPMEFEFSEKQETTFLEYFTNHHDRFYALFGGDSLSIIRRLASMCYRIAMTLSVSRIINESNTPSKIECVEVDFEVTLSMVETFIKQAESIYMQIPKTSKDYEMLKTQELTLYDALGDSFSFSEALKIGLQHKIPKGTVERYLRKFIKYKLLERPKHGQYAKMSK